MYSFKSESNEIDITIPLMVLNMKVTMQEKWYECALPVSSNHSVNVSRINILRKRWSIEIVTNMDK